MAKGLEDTAFYVYNRLVSLNEVGGEPISIRTNPGCAPSWSAMERTRCLRADGLSTHDTKRSEDVRARINVLSESPRPVVRRPSSAGPRSTRGIWFPIEDHDAPDRNEEFFFYQNLLGAWPMEEMDEQAFFAFRERIRAFMAKAVHEAKVHSSWQNPDQEYDEAIDHFVHRRARPVGNHAFLDDFLAFQRPITTTE